MILNVPDTRQAEMARRLQTGQPIVATDVAAEFDVSPDTVRRDILALEAAGVAHRVRGGAIPTATPAAPIHERLRSAPAIDEAMIRRAIDVIGSSLTLIVDGGTTALRVIERLPALQDRLVITPSPWVAIAGQQIGLDVVLIGGRLRPRGGIATGDATLRAVSEMAADIAILGACGIDPEFGLSADDYDEAGMKRAMLNAAERCVVVTDAAKVGRRARHRVAGCEDLDFLVTNADATATRGFAASGLRVLNG